MRLLGGLRETLGGGQRRLRVPAASVSELLEALVAASPDPARSRRALLTDAPGQGDLQVLVNGRSIALLDGPATRLGDGDVVTLHHVGARGLPGG